MRVLKVYEFRIDKKIPFSDWPEIVHKFMASQNLINHRFFYYFEELAYDYSRGEYKQETGSCGKALKDCPILGEIQLFTDYSEYYRLSNIDRPTECVEDDILPIMTKIHRRYGFEDSNLYYYDIDFFGKVIPCERDLETIRERCMSRRKPFDPAIDLKDQLIGSGIRLRRTDYRGTEFEMSIDILHNGEILDAEPYFEAMKALLPGIRTHSYLRLFMSEDEKKEIAKQGEAAEPIIRSCSDYFADKLPLNTRNAQIGSWYSVSPKIKALARQHGFVYKGHGHGAITVFKRTKRGHYLNIMVDSGPSRFDVGFYINFDGLGFHHRICTSVFVPYNQQEFDSYAETVFGVLLEFIETHLPKLDMTYRETPQWYSP